MNRAEEQEFDFTIDVTRQLDRKYADIIIWDHKAKKKFAICTDENYPISANECIEIATTNLMRIWNGELDQPPKTKDNE